MPTRSSAPSTSQRWRRCSRARSARRARRPSRPRAPSTPSTATRAATRGSRRGSCPAWATRGAAARRAGRTRIPRAHPPPSACSTSCSDADVVRRQRRLALGVLLAAATRAVASWAAEQLTPATASELVARLRALLVAQPAAPTLAAALRIARDNGWDGRVVQAIVLALADAIERPAVRATVAEVIDELL